MNLERNSRKKIIKMSNMAITIEQLEQRMKKIMIDVDPRAADSVGNARDRAIFAKML